jgi:hypothetical protein
MMAPRPLTLVAIAYAIAIFGFIFLPVIVLVLFSLQGSSLPIPPFNGPSLRWYVAVIDDPRPVRGPVTPGVHVLSAAPRLPAWGLPPCPAGKPVPGPTMPPPPSAT